MRAAKVFFETSGVRDVLVPGHIEKIAKAFHERHRKVGVNKWEEMSPRNRNYWRDEALFAENVVTGTPVGAK